MGRALIDPYEGTLHILGRVGSSRFMLHRAWVSPTPLETCVAGEDADGDGLVGCDDPDCFPFWACPPYVACP